MSVVCRVCPISFRAFTFFVKKALTARLKECSIKRSLTLVAPVLTRYPRDLSCNQWLPVVSMSSPTSPTSPTLDTDQTSFTKYFSLPLSLPIPTSLWSPWTKRILSSISFSELSYVFTLAQASTQRTFLTQYLHLTSPWGTVALSKLQETPPWGSVETLSLTAIW